MAHHGQEGALRAARRLDADESVIQAFFRLFADQRPSDVRCDPFQEFNRLDGEEVFAPVVELDQPHDPVRGANRNQGKRGVAAADARVAGMDLGLLVGRDVQQSGGIVRPEASSPGEERVFQGDLAGNDQAAGAFQAEVAVGVPAHLAI